MLTVDAAHCATVVLFEAAHYPKPIASGSSARHASRISDRATPRARSCPTARLDLQSRSLVAPHLVRPEPWNRSFSLALEHAGGGVCPIINYPGSTESRRIRGRSHRSHQAVLLHGLSRDGGGVLLLGRPPVRVAVGSFVTKPWPEYQGLLADPTLQREYGAVEGRLGPRRWASWTTRASGTSCRRRHAEDRGQRVGAGRVSRARATPRDEAGPSDAPGEGREVVCSACFGRSTSRPRRAHRATTASPSDGKRSSPSACCSSGAARTLSAVMRR